MTLILNIILAIILVFLLYLFFRPGEGWWYRLKMDRESKDRIILEDILKNLYHAHSENIMPNVKTLLKELPSNEVQSLEILNKMEERDLVKILENKVKLTKSGMKYAQKIVRAHRLWEQFLAEKTGYDKKDWHKLAEKAEHNLTDEHLDALTKELKRPLFDPHGDPIPYNHVDIPETSGKVLSSFPKGTFGRIVHIQDEPEPIYQKILEEDIHMGSQVEIMENNSQIVSFFAEGKQHDLSPMVANGIKIITLEEEEITKNLTRLSQLGKNEKAIIKGISKECRGEGRRRLLDLGFVKGTEIKISSISPLGDPISYNIRETLIALREEQAQYILIQKEEENEHK